MKYILMITYIKKTGAIRKKVFETYSQKEAEYFKHKANELIKDMKDATPVICYYMEEEE